MKICILTPRFPFPENGGDVLRINNIARYLKSKNHQLILLSLQERKENYTNDLYDEIYTIPQNKLLSYLYSIVSLLFGNPMQIGYYFSFRLNKRLKKIIINEKPDLYISHLIRMVPYLLFNKLQDKAIIEMTDVLSKTYSLANTITSFSLKKFIYTIERNYIQKFENKVVRLFKKCIIVSEDDKNYLNSSRNVFVHPNGIQCSTNNEKKTDINKIVFIGNMRTLQNRDSVLFFYRDIFPIIKKKFPNTVFYIIGAQPSRDIQAINNNKDIFVTGFVESIEEYIKDATVAVAPIRIAAGIQNKILISMANNIPVVLTSIVAKGIPELESNVNCLISDDAEDFARKVIYILLNPKVRTDISNNGFNLVKNYYNWNCKLDGYENLL